MSTLFPHKDSGLDGETCWRMWWSLPKRTSLKKVGIKLAEHGVVSPVTGKPYTPSNVRYQAWKWALSNQEEAYQILRQHFAQKGRIIGSEEWKRIMVDNAKFVFQMTPKNLTKFIARYNLQAYL